MSSLFFRGLPAPYPDTSSLHEQKFDAWTIAVGERSSSIHPPGRLTRTHRGMLPDVDWSRVVPAERPRSLVGRVIDILRGRAPAVQDGAIALSGDAGRPVGETMPLVYSALAESTASPRDLASLANDPMRRPVGRTA